VELLLTLAEKDERLARSVVLKRVPLASHREEFLNPGRNFVPRRNWGGKTVDEKILRFC